MTSRYIRLSTFYIDVISSFAHNRYHSQTRIKICDQESKVETEVYDHVALSEW